MGRGCCGKVPSIRLHDYITNTVLTTSPSTLSPSSPGPFASSSCELKSFKKVMTDVGWCHAMQTLIRALEDNGTWTMEKLPPGKHAIGSQWVYKIKYNSNGSIERLKAHLVVFGNHQIVGIDYNKTFAPVAKIVTVRAFLAITASKNWELHQMEGIMPFCTGISMRKSI
ncbi:uncharacterized mitochondrial protein AtMg00820-like [Humulus lupulus]|uniref:uncharacterized mitochondrial protein AtMg00820-like n=1 Tax=Humulus lupulus TaxID=3486 RepID=UPI002B411AAB|nr:uncharacterized mitochondrial protein AtMg00820-like [Humulus lupulus]